VHIPLMFWQNDVNFLRRLALQEKNLMTARVSMLFKSRASPDMLSFSLCNKKRLAIRHTKRPLFPTTLSIPSYDIGKYVGLRTYQHPSYVYIYMCVCLCVCVCVCVIVTKGINVLHRFLFL